MAAAATAAPIPEPPLRRVWCSSASQGGDLLSVEGSTATVQLDVPCVASAGGPTSPSTATTGPTAAITVPVEDLAFGVNFASAFLAKYDDGEDPAEASGGFVVRVVGPRGTAAMRSANMQVSRLAVVFSACTRVTRQGPRPSPGDGVPPPPIRTL
jgi:hypothetical protein